MSFTLAEQAYRSIRSRDGAVVELAAFPSSYFGQSTSSHVGLGQSGARTSVNPAELSVIEYGNRLSGFFTPSSPFEYLNTGRLFRIRLRLGGRKIQSTDHLTLLVLALTMWTFQV